MDEALPFLERAHSRLLDAWVRTGGTPESATFEFALGRIYFALDGRYDPLACVREIVAALGAEELPEPELRQSVLQELSQAERLLVLLQFRGGAPRSRQMLSEAEPRSFDLERPVLVPSAPAAAPAPPAPPPTPAAVPDGFAADPVPALTIQEWNLQRLEESFSEICALGTHRIPQLGDPWRSAAVMEERLLRSLDALLALDRAQLGALEKLVLAAPAPDPQLLFGLAFVGGCLTGRDGLGLAERVLRKFEQEPGFADAWAAGLALAPHRGIDALLRAQSTETLPERRAVALGVLARRGSATPEELWNGCRDVDSVSARALVPFVLSGDFRTRQVLDEMHARATEAADSELFDAFLIATTLAGWPMAGALCERALHAGNPLAARLFGISAERRDAERLLEWTATQPTEAYVDALGWAGDPACIPLLLGLLGTDSEELAISAAAALERISGAGLLQWFDLPAEDVMEGKGAKAGTSAASAEEGEDAPEGSPDRIELPSRDQAAWQAFFVAHQERFVPQVRTRRGVPYSPTVGLYELDEFPCTPRERKTLHYELVVRSGILFDFDENAFVPEQERRLAALREPMQQRSGAPGSWDRPLQRISVRPG